MERPSTKTWFGRACAVAALSVLAACGGNGNNARPAKVGKHHDPVAHGGGPVTLVTAVDVIAKERCRHETRCNHVGAGRRFASDAACQKAFVHEERASLSTEVCETGYVEPEALLDCLEAIRNDGCSVDAEAACEASSMCSP